MQKVNAFLAKADIEFTDDGLAPRVDPHRRLLKRRFVLLKGDKGVRWDRGGWLFGDGFWLNLKSTAKGEHQDRRRAHSGPRLFLYVRTIGLRSVG